MIIFHIVMPEVWAAFDGDEYRAESLATEGFIHCSFAIQLERSIERHYGDREKVIVLTIDSGKLTSKLVVEPSTGGEHYPHIYGPINRGAILKHETKIVKH
ncbi:MAG: DUF952 domain-containing protein [Chloracidobacterium sp.]|nr:DUF952 domain-containing protein [Chloracidobacterium sp.]MCO5332565.1 DUF952 domain-containing protein [Pyrinomonadaceae bacterium]